MAGLLEKIKVPHDRFEMRLSGSGGQGMIRPRPTFRATSSPYRWSTRYIAAS